MQSPENEHSTVFKKGWIYLSGVGIRWLWFLHNIRLCLWISCLASVHFTMPRLAVILELLSVIWIWNLQSFQILWQTMCIIHVVRTYLFMWIPLKLSWRHGGEKNIWQNKPLAFHCGDRFRLVARTRLVLEIKKETPICIINRVLEDLPHVCLLFFLV